MTRVDFKVKYSPVSILARNILVKFKILKQLFSSVSVKFSKFSTYSDVYCTAELVTTKFYFPGPSSKLISAVVDPSVVDVDVETVVVCGDVVDVPRYTLSFTSVGSSSSLTT